MVYTLVKPLGKSNDRYLCAMPKRAFLKIGELVVYIGKNGEERIGVVAVPDFEADEDDMKTIWGGQVTSLVAELVRVDVDWPEDALKEPIEEID